MMPSLDSVLIVALTFLLAGFVKGMTGLGLPSISLAILTVAMGLQPAMAILLIPSFLTNVWQGLTGGYLAEILRRTWSLLLALCLTTWLGVGMLAKASTDLLAGLLGVLLCLYAASGLFRLEQPGPGRAEPWISPLVGALSGILNGLTGSFVVPGVSYLQSLRLPREAFIQAMGVLFATATVALGTSLQGQQMLSADLAVLSASGVIPAVVGMLVGQAVRVRVSEAAFRNVFFAVLLVIGGYIVVRALMAIS